MEEKRRFSRILFSCPALLQVGDLSYEMPLLDLSLKGALLTPPANWPLPKQLAVQLSFNLPETDIGIVMNGHIAHASPTQIGIVCDHLDIDSATHLRRIVELNLGNEDLLHRELDQLLIKP